MARPLGVSTCAFCGDSATKIVEFQVCERPEPRSGKGRGKRLYGTTKRVCDKHANGLFRVVRNDPKDRQQKSRPRA